MKNILWTLKCTNLKVNFGGAMELKFVYSLRTEYLLHVLQAYIRSTGVTPLPVSLRWITERFFCQVISSHSWWPSCFLPFTVLSKNKRLTIIKESLPSLVGIGRAFPALTDDLLHLMVMYGRVASAQSSLLSAPAPKSLSKLRKSKTWINTLYLNIYPSLICL